VLTTRNQTATAEVIANLGGLGFSIVDEGESPTVTSYDVAGGEIGEARGGFDDDCGIVDVAVSGGERLVLTQLRTEEPAEGVKPARYSLELSAWNAESDVEEWSSTLVRPGEDDFGCSAPAITSDRRWALVSLGAREPLVVDLRTGQTREQKDGYGTLGKFIITTRADAVDVPDPVFAITDPATGRRLGALKGVGFDEEGQIAPTGGLFPNGGGGTPVPGITSDGERLIALPGEAQGNDQEIVGYSLPEAKPLWRTRKTYSPTPIGDGGGTFVFYEDDGSDPDPRVKGLDDRTGKYKWSLPNGEVCAITNREMLVGVNGQLAVIDIATGKQLSFDDTESDCPVAYPGGIAVEHEGLETRVVQILHP
jgi:hypothetical protein